MVAFTASGNTVFTVPNDTPQIATSDNGVIGASGTTYDQNGNVTGQNASVPTQSWTGSSYQLGSVDQVAYTPIIAASLWAWQGGNPSGSGTAGRPWFFILSWQNDFTFTPDYPAILPNLTTNITNSETAIKTAALAAIKKAYLGFPVTVVEGTPGTGDDLATVLNHQTLQPNSIDCGVTPANGGRSSQIDYINIMEQAQDAL